MQKKRMKNIIIYNKQNYLEKQSKYKFLKNNTNYFQILIVMRINIKKYACTITKHKVSI